MSDERDRRTFFINNEADSCLDEFAARLKRSGFRLSRSQIVTALFSGLRGASCEFEEVNDANALAEKFKERLG